MYPGPCKGAAGSLQGCRRGLVRVLQVGAAYHVRHPSKDPGWHPCKDPCTFSSYTFFHFLAILDPNEPQKSYQTFSLDVRRLLRCTHMFPRQTIPLTSRTLFGWQTMLDLVEIIYLEERRDRNAQSEIFSTAVYYMCNWRHKIWSDVICIFKIWGVLLFYRLFHSTIQMSLIISMTRVIAQLSWFVNLIFICYLSTHTNT